MLWCLLFGRHEWGEWFRSGMDDRWIRGCKRCPEIDEAASKEERP